MCSHFHIFQRQEWSIAGGTWTSMANGTMVSTAHSGVGQVENTAVVLTLTGSAAQKSNPWCDMLLRYSISKYFF